MNAVALVQFSYLDLKKFITATRGVLDRSVSEKADRAGHEPPLHHMLCVVDMHDEYSKAISDSCGPYLNLFHAGFLIAADELVCAEVMECAGMPATSTLAGRTDKLMFVSGTLSQWRDAIVRGCCKSTSSEVRRIYNRVYQEFANLGLVGAFNLKQKFNEQDQTLLLEYKSGS
jgi:hypothetical protein